MVWEIMEVNQGQLSEIRMEVWMKKEQDRLQQWGEVATGAA